MHCAKKTTFFVAGALLIIISVTGLAGCGADDPFAGEPFDAEATDAELQSRSKEINALIVIAIEGIEDGDYDRAERALDRLAPIQGRTNWDEQFDHMRREIELAREH